MTEAYQSGAKHAYYGLLPESISHEGYAQRPVHSYWDDFFALRGLEDAARMAVILGDDGRATRFAEFRDSFRRDLYASLRLTIENHGIDYIPGSVELADFDPSATAIALDPGGELTNLPEPTLQQTFQRYYVDFVKRRDGELKTQTYSPYELRTVGALVRLGRREQALEVLGFLISQQRPTAWNQWPEIIWRDPTAPRFIGDMPHTWVGAGLVRAVRSLLAYERESDQALVLAAGIPPAWLENDRAVGVKRLPTHYGILNYELRGEADGRFRLRLSGDVHVPAGGIVVQPPLPRPLKAATVNGKPLPELREDAAVVREFPADVVLEY
jgi:hypothetical protein